MRKLLTLFAVLGFVVGAAGIAGAAAPGVSKDEITALPTLGCSSLRCVLPMCPV